MGEIEARRDFKRATAVRLAIMRSSWSPSTKLLAIHVFDLMGLSRGRCEKGPQKLARELGFKSERTIKKAWSEMGDVLVSEPAGPGRRAARWLRTDLILERWSPPREGAIDLDGGEQPDTPSSTARVLDGGEQPDTPSSTARVLDGGEQPDTPPQSGGVSKRSRGGCPNDHGRGDQLITPYQEDLLEDLGEGSRARSARAGTRTHTREGPPEDSDAGDAASAGETMVRLLAEVWSRPRPLGGLERAGALPRTEHRATHEAGAWLWDALGGSAADFAEYAPRCVRRWASEPFVLDKLTHSYGANLVKHMPRLLEEERARIATCHAARRAADDEQRRAAQEAAHDAEAEAFGDELADEARAFVQALTRTSESDRPGPAEREAAAREERANRAPELRTAFEGASNGPVMVITPVKLTPGDGLPGDGRTTPATTGTTDA